MKRWGSKTFPKAGGSKFKTSPQILAGALLLVALAVTYHGVYGQTIQREVQAWLGSQTVQRPGMPTSLDLPGGFAAFTGAMSQVNAAATLGDWSTADAANGVLENTWSQLSEALATAGVDTGTINGVSAEVGDLSAMVSQRNLSGTQGDIKLLQSNMVVLQNDYTTLQSPTLTQIQSAVSDLNQAVTAKDWTKTKADAGLITDYVGKLQKGF